MTQFYGIQNMNAVFLQNTYCSSEKIQVQNFFDSTIKAENPKTYKKLSTYTPFYKTGPRSQALDQE